MRAALLLLIHGAVGALLALTSTFVGERSTHAVYPDIMGCETGCSVIATGWPLTFVSDYPGMSVVNTADMMEVWFAADRFEWLPFLASASLWGLGSLAAHIAIGTWRLRTRAGPGLS